MILYSLYFGCHLGLERIHEPHGLVRFRDSVLTVLRLPSWIRKNSRVSRISNHLVLSVLWPPSWIKKNSRAPQIGKIQRFCDMLYHDLAFGRHLELGRIHGHRGLVRLSDSVLSILWPPSWIRKMHGHRGLVRFYDSVLSVLWPPSWIRKNSRASRIGKILYTLDQRDQCFYFIFCRLYPFFPQPVFGYYLSSLYS
jgi:hypothetical protein